METQDRGQKRRSGGELERPCAASSAGAETDQPSPDRRLEFAEDRTILANERTFAAWMRTSLACIAIGIGFHALFSQVDPEWVPRAIATSFLLMAILVIVLAERRAAAVIGRLQTHVVLNARRINLRLFTAITCLGATGLVFVVWLMEAN